MQQNWQEIPKMLEFCNKKKIFVYFNTVYTEGFAISHMSEEELKSIVDYYNNISFKSAGIIQKRNIRFFENLKSQINTWYLEKFNDGLQYKKRHEFTSEKVYEKLVSISLENEEVIKIINSAFNFEPRVFKLSDNDINNLNNLKLEDIEKAINEESLEQIQSRIFKFMETGKFGD
ncbi:MAG: hypothetical protein PHH30_10425 [Bacteroidales bacterium]|nr:hypothetical protein [Bacteroidales bacterium]